MWRILRIGLTVTSQSSTEGCEALRMEQDNPLHQLSWLAEKPPCEKGPGAVVDIGLNILAKNALIQEKRHSAHWAPPEVTWSADEEESMLPFV